MFTRELDLALLKGEADVAIHSAKDLPEHLNGGLEVIALYEAFDKTDSLVSTCLHFFFYLSDTKTPK